MKTSFSAFAKAELSYRSSDKDFISRKLTEADVLWDSINTCTIIAKRERNSTAETKKKFPDLTLGIRSFGSAFLMTGNFRIEEALADWAFLNELKRQPDKSIFYYWYKTVQLIKQL